MSLTLQGMEGNKEATLAVLTDQANFARTGVCRDIDGIYFIQMILPIYPVLLYRKILKFSVIEIRETHREKAVE